jgi:hypothetical protein
MARAFAQMFLSIRRGYEEFCFNNYTFHCLQLKERCTEKQLRIILRFYKLRRMSAPSLFRDSRK